MATQEKLIKSLESLKSLINSNLTSDTSFRKKEKFQHCNVIVEALSNSTVRIAPNFESFLSLAIEVFLQLCDDPESDVRMVVDECLNGLIRTMNNGNISKIQIELHKEIKRNGSPRSLRAALWRFAELAHLIRPNKGKPYVANLTPCIIKISERLEESVHDTLASSLPKIMVALGCFTTDNHIKALLKAFLNNIDNNSAIIRRTSASCILTVCSNCRKPYVFFTYILNSLLDLLIPIQDSRSSTLILGVLNCLKLILPHIKNSNNDQEMNGSFGIRKEVNETPFAMDRLLQVYELCLYYISQNDHNVINAALETLNSLLQNSLPDLSYILLSKNGINRNRVSLFDLGSKLRIRSPSQLSVATTGLSGEDGPDLESMDAIKPDIEKWIDESKLSVLNITYAKTAERLENLTLDDNVYQAKTNEDNSNSSNYSNIAIGSLAGEEGDNENCEGIGADSIDKPVLSNSSSEKSLTHYTDDKSFATNTNIVYQEIDIGDFKDKDVSLFYCTRLIVKSFLLSGNPNTTISDASVRVSVKSLSLTCLATILQLCPEILLKYIDKCNSLNIIEVQDKQQISDVLLFKDHSDPQLRGILRMVIANFLKAVFIKSSGDYGAWIKQNSVVSNGNVFELKYLLDVLASGLEDESSNCMKQTLQSLNICLKYILESPTSFLAIPILNYLPCLAKNPYWLVKVTLVDIVAELDYVTIHHIWGTSEFQDKVICNIFFELLKDENAKVRTTCSSAIVQTVSLLYFKQQIPNETTITKKAKCYKDLYLTNLFNLSLDVNLNKKHFIENMSFPFNKFGETSSEIESQSLSRIISRLSNILLTSTSRFFIYGCVETLALLSTSYPPTIYADAWNCFTSFDIIKESSANTREVIANSCTGLFNICISLLCNGNIGYDLNCHLNLLRLGGNLFAGISSRNFKLKADLSYESSKQLWGMFTDSTLSALTEQFFIHILKLLNIFNHVIDEIVPTQPPSKPVLPNLPAPSSLSPIKRRKSDLGEKKTLPNKLSEKDDKSEKRSESTKLNSLGFFVNSPHYLKMYELLKAAYANYKTTLDIETSKKFLNLLKTTLQTFSQLLEVATLLESGRISEEILGYCYCTFNLEPSPTVECVQQLLKSLFGTNLTCNMVDILSDCKSEKKTKINGNEGLFYNSIFQDPYNEMSACVNSFHNSHKIDCDGDNTVMGYLHRRENKKTAVLPKGSEKVLANYIRLFEPMVIKSLQQCTTTSDVKFQCRVLQLLCQLIQLRINYCSLDSDQIFIGFVLKQFEFIEEGQIPLANELIPRIFDFLVNLSYGKQHSKSIISVPKIIQLCDGLMASGQPPVTHCIPALAPVVEDIFLFRNKSNTSDFKELETTREVLLAMLLRLLEYSDVITLLTTILNESKYCTDNSDKWLRWSKQVTDVFLPMLKQNKISMKNKTELNNLRKLMFILNPSVFKPLNEVLMVLFDDPPYEDSSLLQVNRWLGKVLCLLLIVSQVKEELLLLKIMEIQSSFVPRSILSKISTTDPLNVVNTSEYFNEMIPEVIFVRYIFRVIDITINKCIDIISEKDLFLIEEISSFLMFCLYIFQSGSHCKIANVATEIINCESEMDQMEEPIPINSINQNMLKLASFFPTVTFEWCYLLALLNYNNRRFWSRIMQITESYGIVNHLQDSAISPKLYCINLEIVRIGGTIVFCDYLNENMADAEQVSWFLVNNVELLVQLCDEDPVYELMSSLHRSSSASGLVIQAITTKCLFNSELTFKMKILKTVENTHTSQIGNLLCLLLPKLLNCQQLALSRLVANLASRKIELLLTMSMEEVVNQLPKEDLMRIMDMLVETKLVKKHEALVSLLNRLATQFYDISPLKFDQRRNVNPEYVKKLEINKAWYISQVKSKSWNSSCCFEIADLLGHLDYEDLINIMSNRDFNKLILKDCIIISTHQMLDECTTEEPCLLKAARSTLLRNIADIKNLLPKSHQVYKVVGRQELPIETRFSNKLTELLSDELFWKYLFHIIPSATSYIELMSDASSNTIPDSTVEDFAKFSILCLESINYLINANNDYINMNDISTALNSTKVILSNVRICNTLSHDSYVTWLCSSINSVYKLVSYLLLGNDPLPDYPKYSLTATLEDLETISAGHACYQLSILISWLEKTQTSIVNIPRFLLSSIKNVVVSLCRLSLVNSYLLIPPTAWKGGLTANLYGTFNTQIPPLPIEFLQEVDILEEFIYRITLLGWTSRQQFEEIWMCLLGVLSSSPTEDNIPEEINAITHVTSLAVQAITALLMQTLYFPVLGNKNVSKLLHISRDAQIECNTMSLKKLRNIHNKLQYNCNEYAKSHNSPVTFINVFNKLNLDKLTDSYSFGQLSVEYLLISARIVDAVDEMRIAAKVYSRRQNTLDHSGLDLNSCLQFLIDLYSQWIKTQNTPLRILYETMKSIIIISDLFTDKSQFSWMLEVCLELTKTHTIEDEIIQQYLVVGACKAVAVLTPDIETYESVKKLIVQNLKSGFLPSKIGSLHGLLYILQGGVLGNTCIGGLSEEMQLIFPVATDYVQCHINLNNGVLSQSSEHNLLLWALAFYLIENIEESHFNSDFIPNVIQAAMTQVSIQKVSGIQNAVLKGLERLVIKRSISGKIRDQLVKLSLDKLKSGQPSLALPALQMLLTCTYIELSDQLEHANQAKNVIQSNPDNIIQTIEKISPIFDRIRKGFPFEVEMVCCILPDVLSDFFSPPDILNKVLGEFLLPQQPHPKLLSGVVFKVFESAIKQAQLPLLQDWVVFSLSNFTQSFSMGMATWCLTCFFISASTNQWLRAFFPYIQSRIGRYEHEDRKMLCIAGTDFYKHLTTDKQREIFVTTFSKVKDQVEMPFHDLLASL